MYSEIAVIQEKDEKWKAKVGLFKKEQNFIWNFWRKPMQD